MAITLDKYNGRILTELIKKTSFLSKNRRDKKHLKNLEKLA